MITVGEVLKKKRVKNNLSLDEVEKNTRIRKKFLQAIEENAWDRLPPLPYTKGFIRNYSKYLSLKPNEVIAIFRRQFAHQEKIKILPEDMDENLQNPLIRLTPQRAAVFATIFFILIFFSYLFFQYQTSVSPANIIVDSPKEGEVIKNTSVEISGKTDPNAVLSINNEKIALERNGEFKTIINLAPGINTITFESTTKYGKKDTVTRTIQIAADN